MFHYHVTSDNLDTNPTPQQSTTPNDFSGEAYPDDPVSSATAHVVLTVVQAGILPVLTLGGVVMNVINMAVFLRQGLSDRINLCLFSLAVADTGYITVSMATRAYSLISLVKPELEEFWKVHSLPMVGIYAGFLNVSSCLTFLISLERCVCVLWPLKAKNLLSVRRMTVVIVVIFIVCLSCCCLASFKYYTRSYRDPLTKALRFYNQPTQFYLDNRRVVDVIFDTIFNFSLQTVSLLGVWLATLLIALRLRTVLSWRLQAAHAHMESNNPVTSAESLVTRMLLVVCVVFSLCTIPTVAQAFSRYFVPNFEPGRRYNNVFYVTICLMHLMATINSTVNFFIYWTMSTKFKDTLRSILGRPLRSKDVKTQDWKNAGGKASTELGVITA